MVWWYEPHIVNSRIHHIIRLNLNSDAFNVWEHGTLIGSMRIKRRHCNNVSCIFKCFALLSKPGGFMKSQHIGLWTHGSLLQLSCWETNGVGFDRAWRKLATMSSETFCGRCGMLASLFVKLLIPCISKTRAVATFLTHPWAFLATCSTYTISAI